MIKAPPQKEVKVESKPPSDSPPTIPPTTTTTVVQSESEIKPKVDLILKPNALNNAIGSFEFEFLNTSNRTRELGILSLALDYIFQDVFTLPAAISS